MKGRGWLRLVVTGKVIYCKEEVQPIRELGGMIK